MFSNLLFPLSDNINLQDMLIVLQQHYPRIKIIQKAVFATFVFSNNVQNTWNTKYQQYL